MEETKTIIEVWRQCVTVYNCCPEKFTHAGIGVAASLSRMAFDDRLCRNGWRIFTSNLVRQFLLSVLVVTLASGVISYRHIEGSLTTFVMLLAGFYAREGLEFGEWAVKELPKRVVQGWIKTRSTGK